MNREQCGRAMVAAVSETLESMAFMEVAAAKQGSEAMETPVWVTLLVQEPTPGEFQLILPRALLEAIGENIYGPATAISEQQFQDLLAELLNTMVGRFLGQVLAAESFRLGIPQPGEDAPPVDPQACQWHFTAEDLPLSIVVSGAPLLQRCQS